MTVPDSPPPLTEPAEEPLPLTLRFVFVIGAIITVGWFVMLWLLKERW